MKQTAETWVGIFLLVGLALICGLIVFFGDLANYFNHAYKIRVEFADASGLLKGSDVYLSGAAIGKVISDPLPDPDRGIVSVDLRIIPSIKLYHGDSFAIGSAGLMGDQFVNVKPISTTRDDQHLIREGETISGEESASLQELQNLAVKDLQKLSTEAEPLLKNANDIAEEIKIATKNLNDNVLTAQAAKDLKDTIAQLKETVKHADELIQNSNGLIVEAKSGNGVVGRLLTDKKMADDLADFIQNLDDHGPLFYSKKKKAQQNQQDPTRR